MYIFVSNSPLLRVCILQWTIRLFIFVKQKSPSQISPARLRGTCGRNLVSDITKEQQRVCFRDSISDSILWQRQHWLWQPRQIVTTLTLTVAADCGQRQHIVLCITIVSKIGCIYISYTLYTLLHSDFNNRTRYVTIIYTCGRPGSNLASSRHYPAGVTHCATCPHTWIL